MPNRRLKTRRARLAGLWLWLVLSLAGLKPASATTDTAQAGDPCLSDARCNELVATARSLSKAQKHADALAAYQTAYGRRPVSWLLLNIGRVQHKLANYDAAITSYQAFLRQTPAASNPELHSKAQEYLRAAESEKNQLTPQPAPTPSSTTRASPSQDREPIYKKWWFWTTVGVVVVGVALGAGLGGYASRPSLGGVPVLEPYKK